jgi:hypothetical protein
LRPGGLLAGYVIHTPAGLSERDLDRAGDLGPSFLGGWEDAGGEAERAGFGVVEARDVTARFRETALAWLAGLEAREGELREELGREGYEREVERNACIVEGIDGGRLSN